VGLLPYGAFLLLARAYYALGDSRTPGIVSVAVASIGVVVMVVGAATTAGAARVAVLGGGHSLAYLLGAAWLGWRLARRVQGSLRPHGLVRMTALSSVVGVTAWLAGRQLGADMARSTQVVALVVIGLVGGGTVLGGYRVLGLQASLTRRHPRGPAGPVAGTEVPL
jgi:putative peptidoglycan lipid II flippase